MTNYQQEYPGQEEEFYQMLDYNDSIKCAKDFDEGILLSFVEELHMPESQVEVIKACFGIKETNYDQFRDEISLIVCDMENNHLEGWPSHVLHTNNAILKPEKSKVVPKKPKAASKGRTKIPLFICNECNHRFYTVKAAENAQWHGCPGCHGSDIEVAPF